MKKHTLSNYSKICKYKEKINFYYDDLTQVSYKDKEFKMKIINNTDSTSLTETIESTDPDEFEYGMSTRSTFTVESSDPDEFNFYGSSTETRVIENSDPDEFYIN